MKAFDYNWFERHQWILVRIIRSPFGEFIFRYKSMGVNVDRRKIARITPTSISEFIGKENGRDYFKEHFFQKKEYAIRLRKVFYPLWMVFHIWDTTFANNLAPQLNLGFDSMTFNPNAGEPGTTTMDGQVSLDIVPNTWATLHDAADGSSYNQTETVVRACRLDGGVVLNTWGTMIRSFFLYDITALPAGASISGSVHSTYGDTVTDNLGSQALSLVNSTPASNTQIALADYDQEGTTVQATNIAFTALVTGAYNDQSLNAAGNTTISDAYAGAKIVKFGHRLESDRADSPPTHSNAITEYKCNTADNASNKPKLVITYSLGSRAVSNLLLMGVG